MREPWFAPIAHVGKKGNEEFALRPCVNRRLAGIAATNSNVLVAEFTTQHDGELFLFVNDAVLAVPGQAGYFYRNNHGKASVKVEQVRDGGDAQHNCSLLCHVAHSVKRDSRGVRARRACLFAAHLGQQFGGRPVVLESMAIAWPP